MKRALLSLDSLRDAVAKLPDNRLAPIRQAALARLQEAGLPTQSDEDWKYTDLSAVIDLSNDWLARGAATSSTSGLDALIRQVQASMDADWVIFANGEVRLPDSGRAVITLLSDTDSGLDSTAPLAQLNAALLRDGACIRVDRGVDVPKPIGILVVDEAPDGSCVSQARVEIELGPGSRGNVIEYHASLGPGQQFANSVVRLRLDRDSEARYVRIQNRARHHSQTGRLDVAMGPDSRFQHAAFDFGGALIRNDLAIGIDCPGAEVSFDGLYLAGNRQHIDNHTRVDHRVGPAKSRQEYRGILTGRTRCVWNGKAVVHDGADGTDAAQANHNLLLSDKAEIDAKPELEIYADEVKCSHGTTVGQLDEAALFYLRTRGLDRNTARQLLTGAFARAIIDRTPVESTRDALAILLDMRLERLLQDQNP